MKTFFAIATLVLGFQTAQASELKGIEMQTTMRCQLHSDIQDLGMTVEVLKERIGRKAQLRVKQYSFNQKFAELIFNGRLTPYTTGISFNSSKVNFSVSFLSQLPGEMNLGQITLAKGSTFDLACKSLPILF